MDRTTRYLVMSLSAAAIAAIIVSISLPVKNAYAHGISAGFPIGLGVAVRDDYESFNDTSPDMNSHNGGAFTITGTLHNVSDKPVALTLYVSVESSNPTPIDAIHYLLFYYYPVYKDPASWYFKASSNLSSPFVIKPLEEVPYQITLIPLKPGYYHVHSYVLSDTARYSYYLTGLGPGQTVSVTGGNSALPTFGEVLQLYLPLAVGAMALAILVPKSTKVSRSEPGRGYRRGIRVFFAVTSSLHTIWLVGLLFWFVYGAYHVMYGLESRMYSVVAMITIIGAITICGYFAAVSKSRFWASFAISAAVIGSIFYFLRLIESGMFYELTNAFYNSVYTYNLPFSSGIGSGGLAQPTNQLQANPTVALILAMLYVAVAIMAAILSRKYKAQSLRRQVIPANSNYRDLL